MDEKRAQLIEAMKKLNSRLKEASRAYYMENREIMSNKEYDDLFDKLKQLEDGSGIILSDSVTQSVGYEVVSELKKDKHEEKALSLDKTKDRDGLAAWLGQYKGCLSWKLDGLTVVLTYDNGSLTKAVTRGNGEIGEVVTHNILHTAGVPKKIPFNGHLVIRGECLITYSNFKKINEAILNPDEKYKNARNLASGTLRQLDGKIAAKRGLIFKAFELVSTSKGLPTNSFHDNLEWLMGLGFDVVEHVRVHSGNVVRAVEWFENKIKNNDYPSDGLVLQIDDIAYGKSLGMTGRFPRAAKAFKWQDETVETTIREIVWQTSRTRLINPVAVFDPVELDGTTVKRATCNNLSFMQSMGIAVGSVVSVYKANMIIPTIDRVVANPGKLVYPSRCPVCGAETKVVNTSTAYVLMCTNTNCGAGFLKQLSHFVSRNAMNIDGLSDKTLAKFIDMGILDNYVDIYRLGNHPEIMYEEGFGETSFRNLIMAIANSRNTTLGSFIYAFGIPNVGVKTAKDISKHCREDIATFVGAMDNYYDWTNMDGVGSIISDSLSEWWSNSDNRDQFITLANIMNFEVSRATQQAANVDQSANKIAGKTFCITGSVHIFANRTEAGDFIEAHGGKLTNSVTSKTDYLVTNDTGSGSAKNRKAKELGKPILTEEQLIALGGGM